MERAAIYGVVGALWLTGCVWLWLDKFLSQRGEFGITPHPLESPLLLLHGVLALIGLYLLGYVSARHIVRWWPGHVRRVSGGTLAALLAILTLSGFALFFLIDDQWQHVTILTHDVFGVAVAVFALQHWLFTKRRN